MALQIAVFGVLSLFALALLPKQRTLVVSIPINNLQEQYPPISDAWLKMLLGFSDEEEYYLPNGRILLKYHHYEPLNVVNNNEKMNNWKLNKQIDRAAQMKLFSISKRKNAELVNHILKNFASINRLGDAGK